MNGNTEKWNLCTARQLFRAQDFEHAQGCMNRVSVISDNRKVYFKTNIGNLKIQSIKVKAKHLPYLSCK